MSWKTESGRTIRGMRPNSMAGSRQMPSSARSWQSEVLAMALAGLYSVRTTRRDDRIVQCQYPLQLFQRDGGTEALIQRQPDLRRWSSLSVPVRAPTRDRTSQSCGNWAFASTLQPSSLQQSRVVQLVQVRLPFDGITHAVRPTRFSRGPRAKSGCPSGRSPTPGISATRSAAGCRPGWCQSERLRREPPALRPPP